MSFCDTSTVQTSDGVRLRVHVWNAGDTRSPVVLVHGFTSYGFWTWIESGAAARLLADGRRVIALDLRGHGASQRPDSAPAFRAERMARDVIEVADALGLARYGLAGYSLGGVLGCLVVARDPRVERFALCGCVQQILREARQGPMAPVVAAALRQPRGALVTDPIGRFFRDIALRRGSDLDTMALCIEGLEMDPPDLAPVLRALRLPTQLIGGREDFWMAGAERLAAAIPGASVALVTGDHFTALSDPAFADLLASGFSAGGV